MEKEPNNKPFPIDAVIPWVDGNDPVHQEKLRDYVLSQGDAVEMPHSSFFREVGEIDYCVKSILIYAPFIRNIFIVTDAQTPNIIQESEEWSAHYREKIKIIDHTDIYKDYEEALPTFNSISIEAMLHRIPGLAEHCIYFNDDFFLIKPTQSSHWFENGFPVLRGQWTSFPDKVWYKKLKKKWFPQKALRPSFKQMQIHAASLAGFEDCYFRCFHSPRPIRKSTIDNFLTDRPELLSSQVQHQLRHVSQYFACSLAWHLEIKNSTAITTPKLGVVEIFNPHKRSYWQLQKKLNRVLVKKDVFSIAIQSLDRVDEKKLKLFIDWLNRITDFDFQVAPDTHQ